MLKRAMTFGLLAVLSLSLNACRSPVDTAKIRTPYDRYAAKRGVTRPDEPIGASTGKNKEQALRQRLRPLGP
jgi:hypothetical protein